MPKQSDAFAARLRRLREEAGLTIAQLAEKAGTTRQQVWRLERGEQQPSLEAARKLAAALGQPLGVWE